MLASWAATTEQTGTCPPTSSTRPNRRSPTRKRLPTSKLNVAAVHFTPGARTAWHSHDGGQTLYVTEGHGLVQARGQQVAEIRPGDVISAPDGEEHWHGAGSDNFMTHLSITEGDCAGWTSLQVRRGCPARRA